jgi:hypothetical protein
MTEDEGRRCAGRVATSWGYALALVAAGGIANDKLVPSAVFLLAALVLVVWGRRRMGEGEGEDR